MRCMWDKLTLTHTAFAVCEELKMPCPFLFFFEIEDALSIERACFYACPVRLSSGGYRRGARGA